MLKKWDLPWRSQINLSLFKSEDGQKGRRQSPSNFVVVKIVKLSFYETRRDSYYQWVKGILLECFQNGP